MSALDLIATASDATFAGRVMMSMFTTAQNVAAEDPTTANHAARVNYSQRIFRGEEQPQLVAAHVIASNATISAAIQATPADKGSNVPDSDIQFALSTIWDARSLAFANITT